MKTFTIGFTQKSAQKFFSLIHENQVKTLIDVRLNNISQLAGFAKRDDLKFFLKELCDTEYQHLPELAPTKQMLDDYKKKRIKWEVYAENFLDLMAQRHIERSIKPALLDRGCLLCSEHKPHFCHRRLVVEYINRTTSLNLEVIHLY